MGSKEREIANVKVEGLNWVMVEREKGWKEKELVVREMWREKEQSWKEREKEKINMEREIANVRIEGLNRVLVEREKGWREKAVMARELWNEREQLFKEKEATK